MAERRSLLDHVRRSLADSAEPIDDIVVAVSGGPDSVALLRALVEVVTGRIVVAHFNHGLRGAASDEDEAFVRDLADRLARSTRRVSVQCHRAGLAERPKRGNLEAIARRERYAWLTRTARDCDIDWVATGHTADDQAETVLLHLLRGTGLDGLRGIAPTRSLKEHCWTIRPLLLVTRQSVLAYLAELGQDFRTDESNADCRFTRNRIRHELLPLLAQDYNPRVRDVLARLASQARGWKEEMRALAGDLLSRSQKPRAGAMLVFDAAVLADASIPKLCAFWRCLWWREGWPRREMGYREWERLALLCLGKCRALDLPGGIHVRREGRVIQVGRGTGYQWKSG